MRMILLNHGPLRCLLVFIFGNLYAGSIRMRPVVPVFRHALRQSRKSARQADRLSVVKPRQPAQGYLSHMSGM
jgi:hypothetical protein